jgi:hypothetical protein
MNTARITVRIRFAAKKTVVKWYEWNIPRFLINNMVNDKIVGIPP